MIPKSIREAAGISGAVEIEIDVRDGIVEIQPSRVQVSLVEREGTVVGVPDGPVPPITFESVRHTLEQTRR